MDTEIIDAYNVASLVTFVLFAVAETAAADLKVFYDATTAQLPLIQVYYLLSGDVW